MQHKMQHDPWKRQLYRHRTGLQLPSAPTKDHRNSDRITVAFFYEKLWLTIIDMATVHADGRMTFKFQGGTEIDA